MKEHMRGRDGEGEMEWKSHQDLEGWGLLAGEWASEPSPEVPEWTQGPEKQAGYLMFTWKQLVLLWNKLSLGAPTAKPLLKSTTFLNTWGE